jgi:hypothetical protein
VAASDNDTFLDLLEQYFSRPAEEKMEDARPALSYQVTTAAVLCCAVLCCAVLCCAVLCCAVLCCAVLCCMADVLLLLLVLDCVVGLLLAHVWWL